MTASRADYASEAISGFIELMSLLRTDSLPDDSQRLYEPKLEGYRAIAFKRNGTVHLRSRNANDSMSDTPFFLTARDNRL